LTAAGECNADGVAVDSNNNLYVADPANHRVLEYNAPLATNNHTANHVWGQAGLFTTGNCNNIALSSTSLCGPTGVGLDGSNNLYIADSSNNRILEYNESTNPPTNLAANHVFGQAGSFSASNDCNHVALGATSLCNPQDAKVSGSALLATDTSNNRVLIYNTPLSSQTANIELGQPDFLHNSANSVDAEGMNGAHGIAVDAANHLYVVDNQNHRVLGFANAANFVNDASASLVIGQKDFFSGSCNQGGTPSSSTFCLPVAVATDSSNNLYVSDFQNNRILEFNAPFTQGKSQGFSANNVYGQSGGAAGGCNRNTGTPSATTLCGPDGLAVDTHNNLYVADRSNNRVLEYPSGSTTAVREFGQGAAGTNFSSATCNNGGVIQSSLCNPFGVATDSKNNVYIADHDNNRALEYNETTNPPSNFTANTVFGQGGSFNSNTCNQGGLTADSLCTPHKLTVDSHSNVYISDIGNNRVLEYKTPLTSGTTADLVFGQVDSFTTNRCDFSAGPSAGSLCGPVGVAVDGAQDLLVGDFTNNRVLKYLQPLTARAW
jgi:sugar lactone lactonase YvrE